MAASIARGIFQLRSHYSETAGGCTFGCRSRLRFPAKGFATFRQSSLNGDWIVYSASRGNRPRQTQHGVARQRAADLPEVLKDCPFCKGNEAMTPPALLEFGATGCELRREGEDWGLRVVPNKFPAVAPPSPDESAAVHQQKKMQLKLDDDNPLNNTIPAYGHHEVVVESPRHNAFLASEPLDMTRRLVWAWRERGRALRMDRRVRHVHFFKNHGGAAGASLAHPHSQVVALPIVANNTLVRINIARNFFVRHQTNVFERMAHEESKDGRRVLEDSQNFIAIVPFAAVCPYELLILPKTAAAYFEDTSDEHLDEFAAMLHRVLRRLHLLLDEPSFNMTLRTAPYESVHAYDYKKFWSWRCNIYPRLGAGAMAGFEFGSGIFSNSMLPEDSARDLQNIRI